VSQAVACGFNSCALTVGPLRSGLIRPFPATTGPSDFRRGVAARAGSPRFLDFSFPARCLQSPRGACRLHTSAASPTMAGFVQSGRLAAPTLCNEAESSSIASRLAGSPRRASPWGLLLSTPGWLHVGHLFDMLITFQINREASLGLPHRISRNEEENGCS
jgi:hypothetical protein